MTSPILVTGAHRTGTTWVGKMLTASGESAYISEPLNIWHRPGVFSIPTSHWYTYICPENEAIYLDGLRQTLNYRYHLLDEIRSLRSRKDVMRMGRDAATFLNGRLHRQRPLLKDPFAVFSAPWFKERLDCQVVITIRHPAAFVSSLKRLGWSFDFSDLLEQPLLMRDWLEPFRSPMEELLKHPDDVIGQGSLLWEIIYRSVMHFQSQHPDFQVARHEDLSLDPISGFQALYAPLSLTFNEQAQNAITNSSNAENPGEVSRKAVHAYRLNSQANLHNWKKRLETGEIQRIRAATEKTTRYFYPDLEWE
jgi:hypothetical protein